MRCSSIKYLEKFGGSGGVVMEAVDHGLFLDKAFGLRVRD
jgi:hypothetical protein